MQLRLFFHIDCPILTVNCLKQNKTKKAGESWRKEFTSGNENELLQKPVLVVVSVIKRVRSLVCLISLYVFVNLYFSSKH